MKRRILFTGGGGAATEALWRLLSKNYDVYFADASMAAIPDIVPRERRVEIAFADTNAFIPSLQNVCSEKKIDLLVPGVDEELLEVANSKDVLPDTLIPSAHFIRLMLDKLEAARSIERSGLPVPKTGALNCAKDIGFPIVVKPRSGRGSRGVHVLHSVEEIEAYKTLYRTTDDSLLAQEYVKGTEYTVMVAGGTDGSLRAVIPVRVEQKRGITIRAEVVLDGPVIDYVERFHEKFRAQGVYNVQCMRTDEGAVLPFEVNPRVSTTFCMAIACGFDPFSSNYLGSSERFEVQHRVALKRYWNNQMRQIV